MEEEEHRSQFLRLCGSRLARMRRKEDMALVDLDEAPALLRELDEGKGEVTTSLVASSVNLRSVHLHESVLTTTTM